MTILPNLDILILQRRGEIMLYKQDTGKVKQAGFLNVYFIVQTEGCKCRRRHAGTFEGSGFQKQSLGIYLL